MKAPLRVGIALDGFESANWVGRVLRQLVEAPFCDLVLCVLDEQRSRRAPEGARLLERLSLFDRYSRLDDRVYGRPGDALATTDLEPELRRLASMRLITSKSTRAGEGIDDDAMRAVLAADLDVLVDLGSPLARGRLSDGARYGAWSIHHGDSRAYRGGPSFFWEAFDGSAVTGQELQVLEGSGSGRVLTRSWSATDAVSLRRGRSTAYWKAANFFIRRLRDLHREGWEAVCADGHDITHEKPARPSPTNLQTARWVCRIGGTVVARRLRRLVFREQWFIAFRQRRGPDVPMDAAGFELLTAPRDRFFADPVAIKHDGVEHILFEDLSFRTRKGVIAYVTLREGKPTAAPKLALERDYHLSYPFIFEWRGTTYMIPETSAARTIELYRAERVPDRWCFERVLLDDINAADATLLRYDHRFWLFAAVAEPGATKTDELCVFWAEDLDGRWTSHPRNPVVSDVRRARPAGRILTSGEALVRPAQDCSRRYGGAIVFHTVEQLSTTEYRESVLKHFDGAGIKGLLGTHTYNRSENYEVIDGIRPRASLSISAFRPPGRD